MYSRFAQKCTYLYFSSMFLAILGPLSEIAKYLGISCDELFFTEYG